MGAGSSAGAFPGLERGWSRAGSEPRLAPLCAAEAVLEKRLWARCCCRERRGAERCGLFSSSSGVAARFAGNSLPAARARCSQPATALAAAASTPQLAAAPLPLPDPCQGWQWPWEGRSSPLVSLP